MLFISNIKPILHKTDLKEIFVDISAVVFTTEKEKSPPFFLGSEIALRNIHLMVN